jgi:hypothetical protein
MSVSYLVREHDDWYTSKNVFEFPLILAVLHTYCTVYIRIGTQEQGFAEEQRGRARLTQAKASRAFEILGSRQLKIVTMLVVAASLTIISVFRYRSFMAVVNRICVGTYVEKDSKCDLATESRSMSDISRTLDIYVMRCSRMIYKYHFLAQYKELRPPL